MGGKPCIDLVLIRCLSFFALFFPAWILSLTSGSSPCGLWCSSEALMITESSTSSPSPSEEVTGVVREFSVGGMRAKAA